MNDNKKINFGTKMGKLTSNILAILLAVCIISVAFGLASCVIIGILKLASLIIQWMIF